MLETVVDAEGDDVKAAESRHRAREGSPAGIRSWLVLAPRQVWNVAIGLILLQAVLRLLMALGTYFWQDDFVLYTIAGTHPFDLDYLFQARGSHLLPARWAVIWPLAHYAPLEHGPAVLVTVVLQVLASLAVLGLLRELFGLRTGILAPLTFYLFGALTLPAFLWWTAALGALGLQLAMALALRSHVRWLRRRRWSNLLGTCLATLLGLAFFEKAVVILPLLIGLTWVIERRRGALRDLGSVLLRHWAVWLLLGLINGAWIWLFVDRVTSSYATEPTPDVAADLVVDSVGQGLVPAVFGGPWTWSQGMGFATFAPSPPTLLLLGSWAGLVLAVGLSTAFRRGMGRLWVVLVGYVGLDLALVTWARADAFGSGVGLQYRYFADVALPLSVLIGYAFLPLRDEVDPWRVESRSARRWIRQHADPVRAVAWLCLILWAVSATWSSIQLADLSRANPARAYVETAKEQLAALPDGTQLLNETVPPDVLLGWFTPFNGTAEVFAPLHDRPDFVTSATELLTITPEGTVVPAVVSGVRTSEGPALGCGWPVSEGATTSIPLQSAAFPWTWTIKVSYLAGTDTPATFTLGTASLVVPLSRGAHEIYFTLPDGGTAVDVALATPGAGVCINRIDVGNRTPEAAPSSPPTSP